MKIAIHNLYGVRDHSVAYYRKQGMYCFDFVTRAQFASELTAQECEKIMNHTDWYCKQYNASHMTIEGV